MHWLQPSSAVMLHLPEHQTLAHILGTEIGYNTDQQSRRAAIQSRPQQSLNLIEIK